MSPGPEADPLHLEQILERIALIRRSLEGLDRASFSTDLDVLHAIAFRLSNIGESTRKLSPDLKARHTSIPWEGIYRLRNIVVHAYPMIDSNIIWNIATTQLDPLEVACRAELERLGG